jgi:sulfur-carrier protein adenylyltransferase/sulfurtransferase
LASGSEARPGDAHGVRPARPAELDADERLRYHRQMILPEVGAEGQRRLRQSSVLVVGAGGLGSPAALYLAAAGVGRLGIVDSDLVDLTNLHRQLLHDSASVGRRKTDSARERLARLNPGVEVVAHDVRLDASNALEVFSGGWDLVVDGSDNFPTRYLVNDACVLFGLPLAYGAIFRWEGQASVFAAPGGPCYRCLFRDPPPPGLVPTCAEAGVLGALPGLVGSIQAVEALKLLLGTGRSLVGRLLLIDAASMEFRELEVRRDPECAVCGEAPSITGLIDYEAFCRGGTPVPAPMETPAVARPAPPREVGSAGTEPPVEIGVEELRDRLERGERPQILDVREAYEWEIGNLGPAGARLIPLGELGESLEQLDREADLVVYCRTGSRSALAVEFLRSRGFVRARNLAGGINDWSLRVDPSIPRY